MCAANGCLSSSLAERTGFKCDVALIIVSTENTTQGIFIDSDQMDLYESRFLTRAEHFHQMDEQYERLNSTVESDS